MLAANLPEPHEDSLAVVLVPLVVFDGAYEGVVRFLARQLGLQPREWSTEIVVVVYGLAMPLRLES